MNKKENPADVLSVKTTFRMTKEESEKLDKIVKKENVSRSTFFRSTIASYDLTKK